MSEAATATAPQWQRVVQSTMIGADRGERPSSGVARIDALVDLADPAEAWLTLIASTGVVARSGWTPPPTDLHADPFDQADGPTPSRAAVNALELILYGDHGDLLGPWCAAAASAGCVAPPEYLVPLLRRRTQKIDAELRRKITAVLGPRGQWLARLNKDWATRHDEHSDPDQLWQTGSTAERWQALCDRRETDPAQARQMLESTWAQDPPDDRQTFIAAMQINLSDADETFLDTALRDRRKPVRTQAAAMLSCLPRSAFARRMSERSRHAVQIKSSMLSTKLTVTPPDTADEAMKRDGIEEKKQGSLGVKASMLAQILTHTPLTLWNDHPPAKWIAAAQKTDWSDALLLGWIAAAGQQRDEAWSAGLIDHVTSLTKKKRAEWSAHLPALLTALPESRRSAVTASLLDTLGFEVVYPWIDTSHPWPTDLSRDIVKKAKAFFGSKNAAYDWTIRDGFKQHAARCLDTDLAGRVLDGWPTDSQHWSPKHDEMIAHIDQAVSLRQTIHKEFQP